MFCFWLQPFHSTVIVWIKFVVWNQVVLTSCFSRASLARLWHDVWNRPDLALHNNKQNLADKNFRWLFDFKTPFCADDLQNLLISKLEKIHLGFNSFYLHLQDIYCGFFTFVVTKRKLSHLEQSLVGNFTSRFAREVILKNLQSNGLHWKQFISCKFKTHLHRYSRKTSHRISGRKRNDF